jgi:hypothetical protein
MQTGYPNLPLQAKTWQLEPADKRAEGYLYYCLLCDEALVLSKNQINPRKIRLVFSETCPGCGFELENVLGCQPASLPPGRRLLASLKCKDMDVLLEKEDSFQYQVRRGSSLPSDVQPNITTGIEIIDKALVLKQGQFAYLQGEPSHSLSLLLSVRATLPPPDGIDSDVVFIDAGNNFDSYSISRHAVKHEWEVLRVHERIHLSRAFTHHQVYNLIMEKLAVELDHYKARLAIVSDITALFCDPDVREKREAMDIFRRSVRFLSTTAEQKNIVVLATNLNNRNKTMEDSLIQTAHISAILKDKGASTQLTVTRHPFISEKQEEVLLDNQTLTGYL